MKVIVKPIKKETWSGFVRFPKCKDSVIASRNRGGYITGLDEETRLYLEKELRLEGQLHNKSDYWKTYVVWIGDRDLELDTDNPQDLLDLCLLKVSKRVCPSVTELHLYPKAEYIIHDAEEEAKKEVAEIEERMNAYATLKTMTAEQKLDLLKLIGKKAEATSPIIVSKIVANFAEDNPKEFNRLMSMDPKDFRARVLIDDLVEENILRINGGHYFFGDTTLGHDLETAVAFIKSPKNQELVMSFKEKLKALKKK